MIIIIIDNYLNNARELKNRWNMNVMVIPIVIGALGTNPKSLIKVLEDRNQKTSGDHSDYNIIKIGQNTEKSLGDLRGLDVAPAKDYQLTLLWKNSYIIIIIIVKRSTSTLLGI